MTDIFENINDCCVNLKIDLCGAELAKIAVDGNYTAETMEALSHLFTYLSTKKDAAMVQDAGLCCVPLLVFYSYFL